MFEIRLDDEGMKEDAEKEKEKEVGDERQQKEEVSENSLCLFRSSSSSLSLILSPTPRTGSGPSEPEAELPGGRGVEVQGLVGGEEGVEPEDSPDSAGRTRQHGRKLRLQHGGRG